jgi:hypothetical protein
VTKYPEHDKLAAVKDKSRAIGEFLERAYREGVRLCEADDEGWIPLGERIEATLARYFEIDLQRLEDEKRAMLDELTGRSP